MKLETLEDCRAVIDKEVAYVDIKPYSHNIISLVLGKINKDFGTAEANKAIEDFDLEAYGWHKMEAKDGQVAKK